MAGGGAFVVIEDVTTQWGVFAIAGPKSRDVLGELIKDRRPRDRAVEQALPVAVGPQHRTGHVPGGAVRVAYTGELGWELHHPIEMQNHLWDLLMARRDKHGLKLVGARAQNWLRQEKSYRAFGTELGRDATPLEADLPRFVDLTKDFHGKAAMQALGVRSKCVTLLIDGPDDADPWGREALYADGVRVGG
jgi:dimethylglycine dehydrogenase